MIALSYVQHVNTTKAPVDPGGLGAWPPNLRFGGPTVQFGGPSVQLKSKIMNFRALVFYFFKKMSSLPCSA